MVCIYVTKEINVNCMYLSESNLFTDSLLCNLNKLFYQRGYSRALFVSWSVLMLLYKVVSFFVTKDLANH